MTFRIMCRATLTGFWLLVCAAVASPAADLGSLNAKRQAQEKARALTGDLVSAVLDVQLRQLQENGLTDLPVYRDIASMKGSLEKLMASDMQEVVQLLVEAEEGAAAARQSKFNVARAKVREVVVRLLAERQMLNRRMGITRLAGDVRQLIDLQSKARHRTQSLPQLRPEDRERQALATIESQSDVHRLFLQLVVALTDVSTWGAEVGGSASEGLRIVKAAQVEPELVSAGQALVKAGFAETARHQQVALQGLAMLLEKLEEAQGLLHGDRQEALRLIIQMRERQQALRERTRKEELNDQISGPLIEQQSAIQKDLGKLAAALTKFTAAEPLLEEAKAASLEATAQLFELKRQPALDEQGRVIDRLAQMEKVLGQGLDDDRAGQSADELAAEVKRLEELTRLLVAAVAEQLTANVVAGNLPEQALPREAGVAETLRKTDDFHDLPSALTAKLNDAKERVAAASAALSKQDPASAEFRKSQTDAALTAIKQAMSELAVQLADMRRRQKAVEVGELARAAEAIERAAAAELTVAKTSDQAARESGFSAEQAAALVREQSDIAQVAEKIAQGIAYTAPAAVPALAAAQPFIEATARNLFAAQQSPGERSRSPAKEAAELARQAANQLGQAASELRRQARQSAQALAAIAGQQSAEAGAAQKAVEAVATQDNPAIADAIARLQEARQKTQEALAEQSKAAGRGQEATARELAAEIAKALAQQDEADEAAAELLQGQANGPLAAASEQQEVADVASELSSRAPASVANSLRRAASHAGESARETLAGNLSRASAARRQARQSLEEAAALAREAISGAAKLPAQPPNSQAQQRSGELAALARQLLKQISSDQVTKTEAASAALAAAEQHAQAALQVLQAGDRSKLDAAQADVQQALTAASSGIDEALAELANQEAELLAKLAAEAPRLLPLTEPIDPGAAAALRQAQKVAGSIPQAKEIARLLATHQELSRNFMRAEANLAARAEQLRRAQDLGQTLDQLTEDQQVSRDAIASAAATLARSASEGNQQVLKIGPEQLLAAQALRQAQQQFAEALRATGEGAVAASGQEEVANVPIREGLEIASRLNQFATGGSAAQEGQPASPGQPSSPSQQPGQSQPPGEAAAEGQTGQSSPSPGQSNPGQSGQPGTKSPPPSALGTGLVPASPEATAQQIAGPEANAAASAAMESLAAEGDAQGQQPGQGEGKGDTQSPMPGDANSKTKKGGAAKSGKSTTNEQEQPGELQVADAKQADSRGEPGGQDSTAVGQALEHESWFTKLPPSLRSAIQAKSRGKAPRGYEERLRRYFESVD